MNCTGKRCIMQFDKVDPATCECVSYCPQATPPKTNFDNIKAMNIEELAEWFVHIQNDVCDYFASMAGKEPNLPTQLHTWEEWLRQEAKNE